MSVLVTGAAGFIGFHAAVNLLQSGETVIGLDIVNDYYDVALKNARLEQLEKQPGFTFERIDVADLDDVSGLFDRYPEIDRIVHLAAQPGVRYSIENPLAYVHSNIQGQVVLMQAALKLKSLKHFVFASTSSIYGTNTKYPFSTEDRTDTPISVYAATKKAAEALSHAYAHMYRFPMTGLRFFTVYGPWGRPDMAAMTFIRKIIAGEKIDVYNNGEMARDFTYIDDIISGVVACLAKPPIDDGITAPLKVYNIGNNKTEPLMKYIHLIEDALCIKADINFMPMQIGDVKETFADISASTRDFGFLPTTPIDVGIPELVNWYRDFYKV